MTRFFISVILFFWAQFGFAQSLLISGGDYFISDPMTDISHHLDIKNISTQLKLLKSLSEEGKTIIFSSHQFELALQIATKVWLIANQRLHEFAVGRPMTLNGPYHSGLSFGHGLWLNFGYLITAIQESA